MYSGGPSGALLPLRLDLLEGSPFAPYRIPGLVLFTVLAVGPLLIWIAVEVWMIGYHAEPPLQLIYGTLGVVLLILTLRPSVHRAVAG